MHKTDEEVLSLLTGNPSTDDNFAAMFCSLERTPSNKLNFPYPDIIYQNLHYTLCKNYLHYIHYLQMPIFSPELSKHCSRNSPSLNLTALRAVLRITSPSCMHDKIITKTNRSHKKPVWQAILFQDCMEMRFVKKTSGTQCTPSHVIVEVSARQKHLKRATGHLFPATDNIHGLKSLLL